MCSEKVNSSKRSHKNGFNESQKLIFKNKQPKLLGTTSNFPRNNTAPANNSTITKKLTYFWMKSLRIAFQALFYSFLSFLFVLQIVIAVLTVTV